MPHGIRARLLGVLGAVAVAWSFLPAGALAQPGAGCASCGTAPTATSFGMKCCNTHCPPPYHHCQEGPPRIRIHHGCAKPICNPCALPHFGHYQTCWTPWPFPANWGHCPTPPPAAMVHVPPGPTVPVPVVAAQPTTPVPAARPVPQNIPPLPSLPGGNPGDAELPQPRPLDDGREGTLR